MSYTCPRCGNQDIRYIGYKNEQPYCRRCIQFKNIVASKPVVRRHRNESIDNSYNLNYKLSQDQLNLSSRLLPNYINHIDSLVYAVCGAGKTEIVLEVIKYALEHNQNVGFAIPRRDVVIELADRFRTIFMSVDITTYYGGNCYDKPTNFMILTAHQLYKFPNYFDLLIMDEIDAFPYKGDYVLHSFFKKACKGNHILMSATPDEEILKEYSAIGKETLKLFTRYHMKPLPVPILIKRKGMLQIFYLYKKLKEYKKESKPVFVFFPSIEELEETYHIFAHLLKGGNYVHSKREERQFIIEDFKLNKYWYLFTTAVLERGVTVRDLQVIVMHADSKIYDRYSLVQIAGRVGRKLKAEDGEVIFLANEENEEINRAISTIKEANSHLQKML